MAFTKRQLTIISNKIKELQRAINNKHSDEIRNLHNDLGELIPTNSDIADTEIFNCLQDLYDKVDNLLDQAPVENLDTFIVKVLTVLSSAIKKLPDEKLDHHSKTHHKSKPATRADLETRISSVLTQAAQTPENAEEKGKDEPEEKDEPYALKAKALADELHNALSIFALQDPNMPLTYHIDLHTKESEVNTKFDHYRKKPGVGKTFTDESHEALKDLDKLVVKTVSKLRSHTKDIEWLARKEREVRHAILAVKMRHDFANAATKSIAAVLIQFPKQLKIHILEAKNIWNKKSHKPIYVDEKTPDEFVDALIDEFSKNLIAKIKNNRARPRNFLALYQALVLLQQLYINTDHIREHTSQKNRIPIHNAVDNALVFAQNKILEFIAAFNKGETANYTQLLIDIGASHPLRTDDTIIRAGMFDAGLTDSVEAATSAQAVVDEYSKIMKAILSLVSEETQDHVVALTGIDTIEIDQQIYVEDDAIPDKRTSQSRRGTILDSEKEAQVSKSAVAKESREELRDHIFDETKDLLKVVASSDKPTLVKLYTLMQKAILCGNKLDKHMPPSVRMSSKIVFAANDDFNAYKPKNPGPYFAANQKAIKQIEYSVRYAFNALRNFKNVPGELQRIHQDLETNIKDAEKSLKQQIPDTGGQQKNKLLILLPEVLSATPTPTQEVHPKLSFGKR